MSLSIVLNKFVVLTKLSRQQIGRYMWWLTELWPKSHLFAQTASFCSPTYTVGYNTLTALLALQTCSKPLIKTSVTVFNWHYTQYSLFLADICPKEMYHGKRCSVGKKMQFGKKDAIWTKIYSLGYFARHTYR